MTSRTDADGEDHVLGAGANRRRLNVYYNLNVKSGLGFVHCSLGEEEKARICYAMVILHDPDESREIVLETIQQSVSGTLSTLEVLKPASRFEFCAPKKVPAFISVGGKKWPASDHQLYYLDLRTGAAKFKRLEMKLPASLQGRPTRDEVAKLCELIREAELERKLKIAELPAGKDDDGDFAAKIKSETSSPEFLNKDCK